MNYINWREIPEPGKKPSKVPSAHGKFIDHLDPANWLTLEEAQARAGGDVHIGLVLPRLDPAQQYAQFLLDLDDCRDPDTGLTEPWASAILSSFPGAWHEPSHSGTGWHVMGFCQPAMLGDRKHKWTPDGAPTNAAEFYHSGRFVALGRGAQGDMNLDWTETLRLVVPVPDAPVSTASDTDLSGPAPDYGGPEDDAALLELMRDERRRKGGPIAPGLYACDFFDDDLTTLRARVHAVFDPDPTKMPPWDFDGSSVDYSLLNHLAYYTGGDVPRMERLHAASRMGERDKALKRPQYVRDAACSAARQARAAGRYLNRPTYDSMMRQVQADPHGAVPKVAEGVSRLPAAERDRFIEECKQYGVKVTMRDAVKALQVTATVEQTAETFQTVKVDELSHYFIVENEFGQPMVFDARGDRPPQSRAAFRDAKAHLGNVAYLDPATGNVKFESVVDRWWREKDPSYRYDATGYHPGKGIEYRDSAGRRMRNVYRPAHTGPALPGAVDPFLHIIRSNFPDPGDQDILLRALAFIAHQPHRMLFWAPVMQGIQGCGKGMINQAVAYCAGRHNTAHPSPDIIATDFNGYMYRKTLIVVNEIGDHTKRALAELAEKLKPWITDKDLHIHQKGKDPFDTDNFTSWLMTTNHRDKMLASQGERRYAHFISALQTEDAVLGAYPSDWWRGTPSHGALGPGRDWFAYYEHWFTTLGGCDAIRGFLATVDVSNMPVRAPKTSTTQEALREGAGEVQNIIESAVAEHANGFRNGWVSSNAVRDLLRSEGIKQPPPVYLAKFLNALGYRESVRVNTSASERIDFPDAGSKTRLHFNPDRVRHAGMSPHAMAAGYDRAQKDEGVTRIG